MADTKLIPIRLTPDEIDTLRKAAISERRAISQFVAYSSLVRAREVLGIEQSV